MKSHLLPKPSLSALTDFMSEIEEIRASLEESAWQVFCKRNIGLAEWRNFLCDDPYTRHGLIKPRGYAGDASLMDYAYRHSSVMCNVENATEVGREIYRVTSGADQSQSARDRVDLVRETVKATASDRRLRVASFAAGHARELEGETAQAIEEFVAVDSDDRSVDVIVDAYGSQVPVKPVQRNVFRLRPDEIGEVDLAYSMGLFDYLNEAAGTRVIKSMARTVRAGGRLLIGNLSDTAANLAYCEGVMDWWMTPRTLDEMNLLGEALVEIGGWEFQVSERGCFYYLQGTNTNS